METYYGNFAKILFRDASSGSSFFAIKSGVSEIICKCNIPNLPKGFPVVVSGNFVEDTYGERLFVKELKFEATHETAVKFIESGFMKGISPIKNKILSVGDDCIASSLRDDIELFAEGLSEDNKKKFVEFFARVREVMNVFLIYRYISPFGGTYHNAEKICQQNDNPLQALKDNVFVVGENSGLNFLMCDKMFAAENGFEYDKKRIIALCTCAMNRIVQCGHTYCSTKELVEGVRFVSKHSAFPDADLCEPLITQAIVYAPKLLVEKDENWKIFRKDLYYQEKTIVVNINRMIDEQTSFIDDDIRFATYKARVIAEAGNEGIKYSENQLKSFNFIKTSGVKVLTGGPGTGKTTVMNGIIKLYKNLFPDKEILLCAPTGRAAQKLSEATNTPASTLHRALNVKPFGDTYTSKDDTDPLTADLIIVDEMSMTDTTIFSILINAVKSSAVLILCGDYDQLPSVGAGNVLHDLIASKKIETNALDVIFRQAVESPIVSNAISVNLGSDKLTNSPDFEIIECATVREMKLAVCDAVKKYYDKTNPFGLQVLSSTKKGDVGIGSLNTAIKEICNPVKPAIVFGNNKFSVGDKIITTRNNYSNGFVNGDIGTIKSATGKGVVLDIKGTGDIEVDKTSFSDVSLGYAITIHKSQGTEYDTVIIVLPKNPVIILNRNLLYTAITRAKKRVILITQPDVIHKTVATANAMTRHTDVCHKLKCGIPKTTFNWGSYLG